MTLSLHRIAPAVALVVAATAALEACGPGGSRDGAGGAGHGILRFEPEVPIGPEGGTVFLVLGSGFVPQGAGVRVRFESAEGTPFLGGASATLVASGQIETDSQIRGRLPAAEIPPATPGPVRATVTVELPGGATCVSQEPLARFRPAPTPPPALSGFAPGQVLSGLPKPFTVTGGPFGPVGGAATVVFVADAGFPFVGGLSNRLVVSAVIEASTQLGGIVPALSAASAATASLEVTFPGGLTSASGPAFAVFAPGQRVVDLASLGPAAGFGSGVAIDGDTAVVGVPRKNVEAPGDGAACVYAWDDDAWQPRAEIHAPDAAPGDAFGTAVAISGDTIVVGSPYADPGSTNRGAAYVFTGGGAAWSFQQKLVASDGLLGDHLAAAVAIDGDTVALGAPDENNGGGTDAGSVYLYERSAGAWTEVAKLLAPGGSAIDRFGACVALSGDTLIAGAPQDDDLAPDAGTAHVFVRGTDGVWAWQGQLLRPCDAAREDFFGLSAALDGETAVVGAPTADGGAVGPTAHVFLRVGTTWAHQQVLTDPSVGVTDAFGAAVDVDGERLFIGAPNAERVYVFDRCGVAWATPGPIRPQVPSFSFGAAVGVSGFHAVVGAPADGSGAVYFE